VRHPLQAQSDTAGLQGCGQRRTIRKHWTAHSPKPWLSRSACRSEKGGLEVSCLHYRNSEKKSQSFGRFIYRHSEGIVANNAATMQTPGQRIKRAYEDAGYKQGEFAKLVGCSQSTLSEIESGDSKLPSAKVLLRMTELLGKSARWIVYGEDGEVSTPTPEEQQMLSNFRNLPPDAQRSLAETIKSLSACSGK